MAKQKLNPAQYSMFIPETSWQPPTSLPDLLRYPVIGFDTETKDPDLLTLGPSWFRGGGHIAGASLSWADGKIYLPVGHEGGDNLDKAMVMGWLRDLFKNYTGTIVTANGFYDWGWCRAEGLPFPEQATQHDVQMVEALLNEHATTYKLAAILKNYGLPPKDEKLLIEAAASFGLDPKSELYKLAARFVGAYAEGDVVPLLTVYEKQKEAIEAWRLEKVVKLEHDLIPLLIEMRFRGIRVDVDRAQREADTFLKEYEGHRREIQRLTGYLPDVWAAESCAAAMDRAGVPYRKTATGKPSFTDDFLANHAHAVPKLISRARKAEKAASAFCIGMIVRHADKNGRIHPEFHPLRSDAGGTVSGRFASGNPNVQQVPVREARMNEIIRGCFLPEVGEDWAAVDYSAQEPRLTVHYAAVEGCKNADIAVKRYNEDPSTDYHQMVADMAGIKRKEAKTINLGLAYGMGGAKLARSLGLSTVMKVHKGSGREYEAAGPEAQAILDRYHEEVPFIRQLSKIYDDFAVEHGYIRTLSSRLCRFPFFEPKSGGRAMKYEDARDQYGEANIKRAFTYRALSRKIQGGSADMVKVAMRNLWKEKIIPLVTVHDELGFSVASKKDAQYAGEIMRNAVKIRVPLKVDIDFGSSWGLAKPLVADEE